jgi:SpoVK/Ycf46/Vps4 family AAA+-type ATPase
MVLYVCLLIRDAKDAVREMITWPLTDPQAFSRLGIRPPTGLLLYGPPGTGKTLLAKAAACQVRDPLPHLPPACMLHDPEALRPAPVICCQSGAGFVSLRISDVLRGEVGSSEVLLRDAFRAAARNAPCIIFIDEFQVGALATGGLTPALRPLLPSWAVMYVCVQALFTKRGEGGSHSGGRLASQLLQCMDQLASSGRPLNSVKRWVA